MERVNVKECRERICGFCDRVSWGSILAGMFTVLAVSVLLSMLATGIGLFKADPAAGHPVSGAGAAFGIWSVISLMASFCAGGFVAGKLAATDGLIHGFVVWTVSVIVSVILAVMLAAGAVRMTAEVLGSVSSAAGSVISGAGTAVKDGVSGLSGQAKALFDGIDLEDRAAMSGLRQDIRRALVKSGVPEFQPDYLQGQLKSVKADLKRSVRKIAAEPESAESVIDGFLSRLEQRAGQYMRSIDRNDVVRAIAGNTDWSPAEVNRAADQYMELAGRAQAKGKELLQDLQDTLRESLQEWQQVKQETLAATGKAARAAARSALWAFFAMLLGAAVSSAAGMYGARTARSGYEI